MLSFEEIKKHYSETEKKFPRLILKEYLQYKILEILFSSKFADKLVFMGGTAVRIVYGSDRFSEDLDIDNCGLDSDDFAELIKIVERELRREGLKVEIRNTFRNVYHCYIKFPALLFENSLPPLRNEKILIRVDSFCSAEKLEFSNRIISKADIFAEIKTYPADIILAQKIGAFFDRKRPKGRDIYDIVYLFSLVRPNREYLQKFLGISSTENLRKKMASRFSEKELEDLAVDVEPFVTNPKKITQVKKFNLWLENIKDI
jgi:predicted nucleotidyltransferase component of viral defense system